MFHSRCVIRELNFLSTTRDFYDSTPTISEKNTKSSNTRMKLIMVRIAAAWALLLGPALGDNDGYCYDAEHHPVRFSDLGSRLDITQALNETCETPVGDHMYACNAAVSAQAKRRSTEEASYLPHVFRCRAGAVLLTRITHF